MMHRQIYLCHEVLNSIERAGFLLNGFERFSMLAHGPSLKKSFNAFICQHELAKLVNVNRISKKESYISFLRDTD